MCLSTQFSAALVYAAALHAEQRRKVSGEPYVAHLLGVASIALEYGADETEAIAALLHDAVEDQGGAPIREKIRRHFGDAVTAIVDGCTDSDTVPKPPWRARKQAYIDRLRHASQSVRLVSAADKLHNIRAITHEYRLLGDSLFAHFRGGRDGTLWYYRAVVDTLKQGGDDPLIDELDRAVSELERLAAVAAKE